MKALQVPEFKSYEEEAAFWDNLDTADFMEDDGDGGFVLIRRTGAIHTAILPDIAEEPMQGTQPQEALMKP